jgi:hypothetical protein
MMENLTDDMQALHLPAPGKCRTFSYFFLLKYNFKIKGKGGEEEQKKKRQTRGGRGVIKTKSKQVKPQRITLARASRGKKKFVTVITGLSTYGLLALSSAISP